MRELSAPRVRQRSGSFCILRLHRVDESLVAALGRCFGVAWPVQPNTSVTSAGSMLWMGPRQWAILDLPAELVAERTADACTTPYHLADVSDGFVEFEISGARSRELLAKGCSLDLHPRVFGVGSCAQTLLAHSRVLLHAQPGAAGSFRLHADVSVAEYVRCWLRDAALEWEDA